MIARIVIITFSFSCTLAVLAADEDARDIPVAPLDATAGPYSFLRQLTDARQRDPIGFLYLDMRDLTRSLAQLRTDAPVQREQQQVIARLDVLIEMLEKQCSGGAGGGSNPTRPLADSQIAKGPGGAGPMQDPGASTRTWGQLSPKQREQILQSQTEGFPPGFESILSSYYKRLAEQNVGEAPAAESRAAPSTQPSR